MIKIGITGQTGFVGSSLNNYLGLHPDIFERILFEDSFFEDKERLCRFVKACDVIVHLAAMNRCVDQQMIYNTNICLVVALIEAMECAKVKPYVLFSSSIHETEDNEYGRSKLEGRILLEEWARRNGACFSGLIIPNVYGPFGKPNYNSVIATFCYKLTHGEIPEILNDIAVRLIYVDHLCQYISKKVLLNANSENSIVEQCKVPWDFEKEVSEILTQLKTYQDIYLDSGFIPCLKDINDVNLFNTFRSYIEYKIFYPKELKQHVDKRGVFCETLKLGIGGQVSFSTTKSGVVRGNHFHIRKIERFIVIKGSAQIQMRKVGSNEVLTFILNGSAPAFVDIPIWYTHNIKNIGDEELYTQFWINEWYDPEDADTYYEEV